MDDMGGGGGAMRGGCCSDGGNSATGCCCMLLVGNGSSKFCWLEVEALSSTSLVIQSSSLFFLDFRSPLTFFAGVGLHLLFEADLFLFGLGASPLSIFSSSFFTRSLRKS